MPPIGGELRIFRGSVIAVVVIASPAWGEAIQCEGASAWIASLTLAMTAVARTTRQPSRLHSLASLIAGTTRSPPAFIHSQALSPGRLATPESTPLLIAHCSLLIRPPDLSPGRLATHNRRLLFAQGIEAEIPQADRREAEELERKARPRVSGDAPKNRRSLATST
jgi:hypothetical protein